MTVPVLRWAKHSHSGSRHSFLIPLLSPLVSVSGMCSVVHIGHNVKIFTISLTLGNWFPCKNVFPLKLSFSFSTPIWTMARLQKKKIDSGDMILQEKIGLNITENSGTPM